jgi:hypothetical protein
MRRTSYGLALPLALAALATPVWTQPQGHVASDTVHAASVGKKDPDALAALDKMGAYLRTLKAFQVRASTTTEEVLADGEKVQFDAVADLLAQRPDKLRVQVTGDRQQRLYLYNGKEFTLRAQRMNYYSTVPAPPTIAELADRLEQKFGIELPFIDLFYWGTSRSSVGDIKNAIDVGPSQVDGTTCEQYAFRQDGLDWQIWIQQGDYPLPRKLVLTTLTNPARPQHTSVFGWNLAPSFNEAAFTFSPPKDAQKIVFAETNASSGGGKE